MSAETEVTTGGGLRAVLRARIELWLVVLFMALAFGAGVVVAALYQEEPATQPVVGVQQPGSLPIAPPLSDEQIQQGLPPGHPDIGVTGPTGAGAAQGAGQAQGGGNP
jgi:hypothetical protein